MYVTHELKYLTNAFADSHYALTIVHLLSKRCWKIFHIVVKETIDHCIKLKRSKTIFHVTVNEIIDHCCFSEKQNFCSIIVNFQMNMYLNACMGFNLLNMRVPRERNGHNNV